jgi:hypothetical protein
MMIAGGETTFLVLRILSLQLARINESSAKAAAAAAAAAAVR